MIASHPHADHIGGMAAVLRSMPVTYYMDQNDSSVGVLVEYGDFRAFFPGDAEVPELQHFLLTGVPRVTVLKVPHHGSEGAVLPSFIAALSPEVAVISCGVGNAYGHPSPMALSAYQDSGAQLFRTDLDGEVRIWGTQDGGFEAWTGRLGKGSSR